ncbi:MAG: hypothetical protein BWK79_04775 [Beggiatoa sp. IS2]|nr:MAG: hypothetical protein BWK79_04775 [Beggiatoa sp. IS2]
MDKLLFFSLLILTILTGCVTNSPRDKDPAIPPDVIGTNSRADDTGAKFASIDAALTQLRNAIQDNSERLAFLESLHIKKGITIPLFAVHFNFGDARITTEQKNKLTEVIDFLRQYPVFAIKLTAFADTVGSKNYNARLAEQRNQAVLEALRKLGLPLGMVVAVAMGEATGPDETNNLNNRRVEIKPYVHGSYVYSSTRSSAAN